VSLLPLFLWLDSTRIASLLRDSTWAFAVIEVVHLVTLALLLGTVVIVDLSLLGIGVRRQPVSELAADLRRWMWSSLAVMVTTGTLLFLSEVMKCYHSPSFRVKMSLLLPAIVFHLTAFRMATKPEQSPGGVWRKATALVSLMLWFGVALAGRAIGFL
jgi:hypothetical protein